MRVKKKTIILAEIRRLIRRKVRQHNLNDELGSMNFWSTKNYKRAKRMRRKEGSIIGDYPYYSKSTRAIEDLAEEVYRVVKNEK